MNLCTFIGHDYRSEGAIHRLAGYPDEYDAYSWCERCDDDTSETLVTRWFGFRCTFAQFIYRLRRLFVLPRGGKHYE